MRVNSFIDIYRQCNSSSDQLHYQECVNHELKPIYLDIELTNCCNIHCNMCPVGTGIMKRPKGFMNDDVFDKICENVEKHHIQGVRLIRWGEPTLHKKFLPYMKRLKALGTMVHFNTNGIALTPHMMEETISMQVDSMKFSFQGIDELTYGEMRAGSDFNTLINNIKLFHKLRGDHTYPYISVSTSTTYESPKQIDKFKQMISPYCDFINVGQTHVEHIDITRMNLCKEREKVYKQYLDVLAKTHKPIHMASCPEIWKKLSINWDGSVSACCSDYDNFMVVGSILEKDLMELFYSSQEMEYRKILSERGHEQLPLCKNCYEYIPLFR